MSWEVDLDVFGEVGAQTAFVTAPLETIFASALELPPTDREAHIAEACGKDAELLAEVRALLAASDAAPTGFLSGDFDVTIPSGPRPSAPAFESLTEKEGDEIGRGTGTFMRSHIPLSSLRGYRANQT